MRENGGGWISGEETSREMIAKSKKAERTGEHHWPRQPKQVSKLIKCPRQTRKRVERPSRELKGEQLEPLGKSKANEVKL